MTIDIMLDQLAEYRAAKDVVNLREQEQIDKILTPEILQQIADIKAEYEGMRVAVDENIKQLEDAIRDVVKVSGSSVNGKYLSAIYSKGRVTWDAKGLDNYGREHPEIYNWRKEGEPYVTIRTRQ